MGSPPHICQITTAHPPFDTRIFRRTCVSLAKAGFRVTLICRHAREETVEGVRVLPLPRVRSRLSRRLWLTRVAARMAADLSADLYHFHDPELMLPMRRLARATSAPVIWDAHEDFVASIRHYNQFRLRPLSIAGAQWFNRLEIDACLKDFAGVVTVSEIMAERYRSSGVPTCVVGNYVSLESVPFPAAVPRSAIPRFTSCASQSVERMVRQIADAYALVRPRFPCEVAFWGKFATDELKDEIIVRARGTGAPANQVITGGPYSWETVLKELTPTGWLGCALMNPANRNNCVGLPNRLFENWVSGVPVIATAGTYVADVVKEIDGGFVIPSNSPEEIADVFQLAADNRDLVEQKGAAGRKAVEQIYNWNRAFANLRSFYAALGISLEASAASPHASAKCA